MAAPSVEAIRSALAGVEDPEIHRPITELGMVKDIRVLDHGKVEIAVFLTVAGCPMKDTITQRVTTAVSAVSGVTTVSVELDVMNDEQRKELRRTVKGDADEPVIPFAQPGSLTRVYAVASGKGGVGKSSVTVNLAAALADRGLSVGVVDADIYGHSVPRMLGADGRPTKVDEMILPPQAHGVKVISIGMFTKGNTPVVWRGPMLHRALQQFLADVFWGDLDVLLLDLPPGTGDIAISVAQLLPGAELLVVTTPQLAAAEVAERAGSMARQTNQKVAGVVENMSWLVQPDGSRLEVFGSGGGERVADRLGEILGTDVPLLGQVPLEVAFREGGDAGVPLVRTAADGESAAADVLRSVSRSLSHRERGLAGRKLAIAPVGCARRRRRSASRGSLLRRRDVRWLRRRTGRRPRPGCDPTRPPRSRRDRSSRGRRCCARCCCARCCSDRCCSDRWRCGRCC
jgi:ATP-binding protein involved in chromosome partitioning